MMALEKIEKADDLLLQYPRIRRAYIDLLADASEGAAADTDAKERIVEFLREAERAPDKIQAVESVLQAVTSGEASPPRDAFDMVLETMDRARDDLQTFLTARVAGAGPRPQEYRELEEELEAFITESTPEDREERLINVRAFIYEHPGHYVKEVYWRLKDAGSIEVAYRTLWRDVLELEERGEIVTIGEHSGVPRYCFPHPEKIQNRSRYIGGPFPFLGNVEVDFTESFEPLGLPARVFEVNHQMREILLLTPLGVNLEPHDSVQGYGKLEGFQRLTENLRYLGDDASTLQDHEVVFVEYLQRERGGPAEPLRIPNQFLSRFQGPSQAAGQT